MRSAPACPTPIIRGGEAARRRSGRCATRTGRPCATSTRPGSPPATPPSRPSAPTLGALGRQPPRRPPARRHRRRRRGRMGGAQPGLGPLRVRRSRREQRLHPPRPSRAHGVGTDLLDALVPAAERAGYWTIQTGIFPENTGQHRRPRTRRVPRRRPPRAHRSARRGVARHPVPRTPQHPLLSVVHETTGWFTAHDGLRLFERSWSPNGEPRAVVAILHGGGEHSGRYGHVAERLTAAGYRVDAFDQRSHGRSERVRGVALQCDDASSPRRRHRRLARPSAAGSAAVVRDRLTAWAASSRPRSPSMAASTSPG